MAGKYLFVRSPELVRKNKCGNNLRARIEYKWLGESVTSISVGIMDNNRRYRCNCPDPVSKIVWLNLYIEIEMVDNFSCAMN